MFQLYNTLSKSKQPFTPIEAGKIRMYVCGVTVYDLCHIGHARVMVSFDVITRYLRARGWDVEYVRNITDVDDKILKRAAENGETPDQLTQRMIAAMHEDEASLSVLRPDQEPRATHHIQDIIDMVQALIDKGFAYAAANGDVYYRVEKFETYGRLTNKVIDELRSGARVEVEAAKESPLDFVLWKAAKPGETSWESPWGAGRPGWHIECSAMSKCCLGETFDIHGGGPDLPFPHHENEIAQSEAANGKTYVNYWMHAGPVRVNKEKMSKSLGNFFTIREVLKEHNPEVVRYFLSSVHYRSSIDYSLDSLKEARSALDRFYQALDGVEIPEVEIASNDYSDRFFAAMDDDFNTPMAFAVLFEMASELNRLKGKDEAAASQLAGQIKALAGVVGLLQQNPKDFLQQGGAGEISGDEVEALIVERKEARANKDFARSDEIRDQLAAAGVILKDGPEGTTWYREG
ncbi:MULTISPECIES: cysteine--tRNA ligase [unclassified Marinobacterium]|uniref:cysteine--tRNA ligase n=1 Tax=unclassified Marinobacterium TaxID=2644139 RepID=UPI001568D08B|nr:MULTISPECIES: cysteine--tRNA ligase [unclassified Marinobacterium]NRP26953.1 Cysteine--tRNA ligase [Marinobacterium sp. xm-d-420]NRP39136.1 Cysteine--tRNA ligase [Marinobacterium sp. xm-a-121]NRP52040.1 Cysteine--tRNA ligase [Marinobacterium sp. xm-v-242]NRP57093.1 Cysteine--tRNA ligase [Marinobacterium sp. xm-d-510]NRP76621.1 Cysteine--tRNA ligase [Marinobacterium sp. xm-m-383]